MWLTETLVPYFPAQVKAQIDKYTGEHTTDHQFTQTLPDAKSSTHAIAMGLWL